MSTLELTSHPLCPFNQRLIITLLMKGLKRNQDFSVKYIDLANIPDRFKTISPKGEMPVLKTDETYLFKTNPINEYLNEYGSGNLHSENTIEKAQERYWVEYSGTILNKLRDLFTAKDRSVFNRDVEALFDLLQPVENHLDEHSNYWRNQHYTLVDGAFLPAFTLIFHFKYFKNHAEWTRFPKTLFWANSLLKTRFYRDSICPNFDEEFNHFFELTNSSFKEFTE
jgi:glutathione S-transferase